MIRYLLTFLLCTSSCFAQQIEHRFIFFGDAGEINPAHEKIIEEAAKLVLEQKTSVYFLGDNIYPTGMGLDPESREVSIQILKSQYEPFVYHNVDITFLAGNHDWDKSGKNGLQKIVAQDSFLNNIVDGDRIKFKPVAGTFSPYLEEKTKDVGLILYDSEYWLFPYHKIPTEALSDENKVSFSTKIHDFSRVNSDKLLLVLSHHPIISYGEHGYNFGWKDHIFPLRRLHKSLFIPLPIIGSIYPILRSKLLVTAEDINHPKYQDLIQRVTESVKGHPNTIFISGHDHGLQLIKTANQIQIVSGSGSKTSHIARNKNQLYVSNKKGFCVLDSYSDKKIEISFYVEHDGAVIKDHSTTLDQNIQ